MTYMAKIIEHSIAPNGKELITYQLCYPRFVHSEIMTHRVFSRNAASSRAIPVAKMIAQVRNAPAMPIHWGRNQPGMQAAAELEGVEREAVIRDWITAANVAADLAEMMAQNNAHKQVVNRILEPFQWMHTIVTATEFDNFFELRDHEDAQPEIRELARQMRLAKERSVPRRVPMDRETAYGWHLPYVTSEERAEFNGDPRFLARLSAARCARVSYLTHDGKTPEIVKDLELYDRLVGSRPLHASPIEHQAYPLPKADQRSNNFVGWRQHRELVEFSN